MSNTYGPVGCHMELSFLIYDDVRIVSKISVSSKILMLFLSEFS